MHILNILLRSILMLVFVVFGLVACDRQVSTELVSSTEPDEPVLTFIVHPYDNPSELIARFAPLCDYLGNQLNIKVKLVVARSYVDQLRRIVNGQADLAYMGPTPFLRAQDHYLKTAENKLIPLAAEVRGGQPTYHSVIVVRTDSPIKTIKNLSGHTLALGAPHSFSSHYVPRVMLGNAGLSFSNLRNFAYLGRHERVALAVLHGDFDAGGLNRDVALRYRSRNPGIRILATSPPLPPHLLVARPGLKAKWVTQLRRVLIAPNHTSAFDKAVQGLGTNTRFTQPNMADFARARRVINAVESFPAVLPTW